VKFFSTAIANWALQICNIVVHFIFNFFSVNLVIEFLKICPCVLQQLFKFYLFYTIILYGTNSFIWFSFGHIYSFLLHSTNVPFQELCRQGWKNKHHMLFTKYNASMWLAYYFIKSNQIRFISGNMAHKKVFKKLSIESIVLSFNKY